MTADLCLVALRPDELDTWTNTHNIIAAYSSQFIMGMCEISGHNERLNCRDLNDRLYLEDRIFFVCDFDGSAPNAPAYKLGMFMVRNDKKVITKNLITGVMNAINVRNDSPYRHRQAWTWDDYNRKWFRKPEKKYRYERCRSRGLTRSRDLNKWMQRHVGYRLSICIE